MDASHYVPNGRLTIRISGGRWHDQDWTDQKHVKLETCLHDVVAGIVAEADAIRERCLREEREREGEMERAQREIDARRRREHEEALAFDLTSRVDDWVHAQGMRGFLRAVERAARSHVLREDANVTEWIA